jgi:uncharacterized membrane protein YvbJ
MDIYRKIAIIFIIIITTYILWRLFNNRKEIISRYKKEELNRTRDNIVNEGFQDPVVESLSKSNKTHINLANANLSSINSANYSDTRTALMISQYTIKSSYQTAWDGQDVSQDMIQYVLNRGCRWLQFDIFWDYPSNVKNPAANTLSAVISYTTDPKYIL